MAVKKYLTPENVIPLLFGIALAIFLAFAFNDRKKIANECRNKGGVLTRCGRCIDKRVFIE